MNAKSSQIDNWHTEEGAIVMKSQNKIEHLPIFYTKVAANVIGRSRLFPNPGRENALVLLLIHVFMVAIYCGFLRT